MALFGFFGTKAMPAAPVARVEPQLSKHAMRRMVARQWMGAEQSRLLADLPAGAMSPPNREIRMALKLLRARTRWLAQNDGFSKGFLRLLRRNVVGPNGFSLQMQVKMERGAGRMDVDANDRIEAAWKEWGKVGSCDVTGRLSFTDACRTIITHCARDGEALVRLVPGPFNRFRLAIQILDVSLLDEDLTSGTGGYVGGYRMPDGNTLRMGVERNAWGRPIAYHVRTNLEGDDVYVAASKKYQRLPADEIMHLFSTDWADQARGVPWLDTAIRTLAMLDGYSEAELVAARVAAGKMGFYQMDGDVDLPAELEEDGALVQKAEAGTFELLPKGLTVQQFDPQHPTQAFPAFQAAQLRSAASGTGLSYTAFANDAAGLSYSALRGVTLEDREEYRTLQNWMIGSFCEPLFTAWLRRSILADALGLPAGKVERFNRPQFKGRGWQWVDPSNEVKAAAAAIDIGIANRTDLIAERGGDFDDNTAKLLAEQEAMKDIVPRTLPAQAQQPPPSKEEPDA